jgi:hypothetical protein
VKVLEAILQSPAKKAATRRVVAGSFYWSGAPRTPIARAPVLLVCDGRHLSRRRTSGEGQVSFTIPMKRHERICLLRSGPVQSGSLTVPRRVPPRRPAADANASRGLPLRHASQ